jgi:hypothetical protein
VIKTAIKLVNKPLRRSAVALLGSVAIAAGALSLAGSATAATTPPWVGQDPNAVGGLAFFNASGAQITGGKLTDSPLAAYVVGTTALRAGDKVATLYGYLPDPNKLEGLFSGEQLSGTTTYPATTAPSPVGTTALPVLSGAAGDETLQILDEDYPQNSTATGYANSFELRLKTSAPGKTNTLSYDYADITINTTANTWTVTYTPPSSFPGGGTTTTTALTATPTSVAVGGAEHLSAVVSPSTAVGSVQFKAGTTLLGAAVPVSAGSAVATRSFATAGAQSVTVVFTPTNAASFKASTSAAKSVTVTAVPATAAKTTTAVSASLTSVKAGSAVTLTAAVTPTTAAGKVQFWNGVTAVGAPVAVSAGKATLATSFTTAGSAAITAAFVPTTATAFTDSTSAPITVTVTQATTTTTLTASAASVKVGASVTLTATLAPTAAVGTVQFKNGTTAIGTPVMVASGKATLTTTFAAAGSPVLTAVFTPTSTASFTASTSKSVTLTVTKATTTTTLTVSAAAVKVGVSDTLTATLAPTTAVGTVQFKDGTTAIGTPVTVTAGKATKATTFTTKGTHSITAVFTPTNAANYTASTSAAKVVTVS